MAVMLESTKAAMRAKVAINAIRTLSEMAPLKEVAAHAKDAQAAILALVVAVSHEMARPPF